MRVSNEVRLKVSSEADVVTARQTGRKLAEELRFSATDQTFIATAISEVARNIVAYAGHGEIVFKQVLDEPQAALVIVASDTGPGIGDVELALRDGYTTSGGMGLGLPGARRLMDEFELASEVGKGTTVVMKKWLPHD